MPTPRKKYLAKFIDIVYHVVMNNINYAWAAGFMDGEGTITLKRTKSRFTVNRIHYQPFVSIGQANHVEVLFQGIKVAHQDLKLFNGLLCLDKQSSVLKRLDLFLS